MSKMNKKIRKQKFLIPLLVFIFLALISATVFMVLCRAWFLPQDTEEAAVVCTVDVPEGATIRQVARRLKRDKLVRSDLFVYYYARAKNARILAGVYEVSSGMNVAEILALLATGRQQHLAVSIPEGFTTSKTASLLEEEGICPASDFVAAVANAELLANYRIPAASAEGYLFPDTYFFTQDMDAENVVRIMLDNFFTHSAEIPQLTGLADGDLFRVVTLASLIEREYRRSEEAPLIASVLYNRITHSQRLEIDATIEYIITEILKKPHPDIILYADLEIDNPYNTYRNDGLPPGPISNPGMVALRAASDPPETPYYYYRVVDIAEGRHHFSKTYQEHIAAGRR
jgi:UPF0755 protein